MESKENLLQEELFIVIEGNNTFSLTFILGEYQVHHGDEPFFW